MVVSMAVAKVVHWVLAMVVEKGTLSVELMDLSMVVLMVCTKVAVQAGQLVAAKDGKRANTMAEQKGCRQAETMV